MTRELFGQVKRNIEAYKGKEVVFTSYIPSADRYTTKRGNLIKIGEGYNEDCLIIGWCGIAKAIYYPNVLMAQ